MHVILQLCVNDSLRLKSIFVFIFLIFISFNSWSDEKCTRSITKNEAKLKTLLLPMDLNDPVGDAKKRIAHKDLRFLSVNGITVYYPGLHDDDLKLLCRFGERNIEGTSDSLEGITHVRLQLKIKKYVEIYNKELLKLDHKELLKLDVPNKLNLSEHPLRKRLDRQSR